ncbi:MAG: hypothetical protein ABSC94_20430 [Polyangiaceae bacterium]
MSLRRLYKKHPHFTNGTADSIDAVLDRARFTALAFFHDSAPEPGAAPRSTEKAELRAFWDLL